MRTSDIILLLATIILALMAGLFFAYSCSVVPGLGRLPDRDYLSAMQSINRAILNPVFLLCFMGTLLLLPGSAWMSFRSSGAHSRFWLLLLASAAYGVGVFGVTMAGNVLLNNMLDKLDITGCLPEQLHTQRAAFEARWNSLNHIRTGFAILALIAAVLACLSRVAGSRDGNMAGL